jgi:hypothetical protein
MRLITISLALFIFTSNYAQQFKESKYWSFGPVVGISNMLGDLGGSKSTNDTKLLDFRSMRPSIGVTGLYNMSYVSWSSNVNFTQLIGDDAFGPNTNVARNLSVRTDILDANIQLEVRPFTNANHFKHFYFSGGVGVVIFQPKAKLGSDWEKLRPLGTEGQLIPGADGKYGLASLVIPFGIGYKFKVNSKTTLCIDFSFRKSFTDYLDDVSTVYADPNQLQHYGGDKAVTLADRSFAGASPGQTRGNPASNDSYFIIGLKLEKRYFSRRFR